MEISASLVKTVKKDHWSSETKNRASEWWRPHPKVKKVLNSSSGVKNNAYKLDIFTTHIWSIIDSVSLLSGVTGLMEPVPAISGWRHLDMSQVTRSESPFNLWGECLPLWQEASREKEEHPAQPGFEPSPHHAINKQPHLTIKLNTQSNKIFQQDNVSVREKGRNITGSPLMRDLIQFSFINSLTLTSWVGRGRSWHQSAALDSQRE